MKMLVPIRSTPVPRDGTIRLTDDGAIDETQSRWGANRADTIGLDIAVSLKSVTDDTVVAVAFGGVDAEVDLIEALARGADSGIQADTNGLDPNVMSGLIAALARIELADLILLGDASLLDEAGQTGPQTAGRLGWAIGTRARTIEPIPDGLRITRLAGSAGHPTIETLDVPVPAVITVDPGFAAPALVSLYAIVAARDKPRKHVNATKMLGTKAKAGLVETLEKAPPSSLRMVSDVDELLRVLREEAHAL